MTVAELIAELEAFDPALPVLVHADDRIAVEQRQAMKSAYVSIVGGRYSRLRQGKAQGG